MKTEKHEKEREKSKHRTEKKIKHAPYPDLLQAQLGFTLPVLPKSVSLHTTVLLSIFVSSNPYMEGCKYTGTTQTLRHAKGGDIKK